MRSLHDLRVKTPRRGAAGLGVLMLFSSAFPVHAAPFVPDRDDYVLERGMATTRTAKGRVSDRRPQTLRSALAAARDYIDLGRTSGDPRYYGRAEALLKPWAENNDPPSDVLFLRAVLRQNRHEFDAALRDLDRVLTDDPGNAQAWLTHAVIHQVRGEYQAARTSCLKMLGLSSTLASTACLSGTASLNGRAAESYTLLSRALADHPTAPVGERRWVLRILADIAVRLGRTRAAKRHFDAALALGQAEPGLLVSYADLLLDEGRPTEVLALLARASVPLSDALLLRETLALKQLGSPQWVPRAHELKARIAAVRRRGASAHLGLEARFALEVLNQPRHALDLALENWARQREPKDVRLVLAAALAANRPDAVRPLLQWLETTGLQDNRFRVSLHRLQEQL